MKKLIAIIISILIITACVPVAGAINYNGFILEENTDGTYTITGCNIFTDSVSVPGNYNGAPITAIAQGAFQLKRNMTFVKIPDTVKTIGSMAFYGCSGLTSVYIGDSVTTIGAKAFNSCTSLTSINLKNTELIGELAFTGCKSLESVNSNGSVKVIGKNAFSNCSALSYFDFGDALLYIDDRAFSGCRSLTAVDFPNKLGYIGNSSFQDCSTLSSVTFGTGELEIAPFAFENCISLKEITIPDNVISIGDNAFALRAAESTESSHDITITCSINAPAISYVKLYDVTANITDHDGVATVFGDFDGDGIVTTVDASIILKIVSGMEAYQFTDYELFLCDLDNNGVMDTDDVILTLKKVAKI